MVTFYKHHIPDWMDGTEALSDAEYRVYHVIVQLIYLHEGPIANNENGLAGRCNMHLLAYRSALTKLVSKGKLALVDGRLSNGRAEVELRSVEDNRERAGKGGRNRAANALKNKHQAQAPLETVSSLKDKTRLDETRHSVPNGTGAAAPTASQWIYGKGKELLALASKPPGNPGAVITKWLREYGEDAMLHALRIAEPKRSPEPVALIEGILRGFNRQHGPPQKPLLVGNVEIEERGPNG